MYSNGFRKKLSSQNPFLTIKKFYFSTNGLQAVPKTGGIILLTPYFVTGFADAESSFSVSIYKNNKLKTGYRVQSCFEIALNKKDAFILNQLQEFFGGIGTLRSDKKANAVRYSVDSLKELRTVIIPHFKKYPLITQKQADFMLFEQIVELMDKGAHLSLEGLQQIINLKASLNLGLSDTLKSEFSATKPVKREIIQTTSIPDPNWVSGFVSGEGNFDAGIRKSSNINGFRVYLRFRITQHERDYHLMELLIKYLGAGSRLRRKRYQKTYCKFSYR